jgi:hypothetical protein
VQVKKIKHGNLDEDEVVTLEISGVQVEKIKDLLLNGVNSIQNLTNVRKKEKVELEVAKTQMDLLCDAYSNSSDEEEEEKPKRQKFSHTFSNPPKPYLPSPSSSSSNLHTQSLIPGSYISKRQRASMASISASHSVPLSSSSFTLSGTLLFLFIYV